MFQGSIVALVTPFLEDGSLDEQTLKNLVLWHMDAKTEAIVVMGTTGESPTISDQEKHKITKLCVDTAKGNIPIIINTGTNSTQKSIELTRMAKELGADGCMAVVPYYNKPTPEGVYLHFEAIGRVGLPLIVYHHPGRTGVLLEPSFFGRLDALPSIVGIKEAAGSLDKMKEMMKYTSIPILSGDDSLTLEMMKSGAKGVISVLANCFPEEWQAFASLNLLGDFDGAKAIADQFTPFISSIMTEANPIGVKCAMSLQGKLKNVLRLPMTVATEKTQEMIMKELMALEKQPIGC